LRTMLNLLDIEPKHRVDSWKTALAETFVPVDLKNYRLEDFSVSLETAVFGDLQISKLSGSEQNIFRPRHLIRSSDADWFIAVIQLSGSMDYSQNAIEGSVLRGGITLFDPTREYRTLMRGHLNTINVTISRKRIEALFGSTRHLAGLSLGSDQPMTKLAIEFFRGQMQIADQLSEETARRLGTIGADLLASAFLEKMGRFPNHGTSRLTTMGVQKLLSACISATKPYRPRLLPPVRASPCAGRRRCSPQRRYRSANTYGISDFSAPGRCWKARRWLLFQLPISHTQSVSLAYHIFPGGSVPASDVRRRKQSEMTSNPPRCKSTLVNWLRNKPVYHCRNSQSASPLPSQPWAAVAIPSAGSGKLARPAADGDVCWQTRQPV
jgi:hypothetical protein